MATEHTLVAAQITCSRRLLARTLPFQGGKDGSKPFGSTKSTDEHVQFVRNSQPLEAVVRDAPKSPTVTAEGLDEAPVKTGSAHCWPA